MHLTADALLRKVDAAGRYGVEPRARTFADSRAFPEPGLGGWGTALSRQVATVSDTGRARTSKHRRSTAACIPR